MNRNFISEQTLVDQLVLSSTEAFEELYHRYCYPLYSYSLNKLNSSDDAKRIVRDIFIVLWEKRQTLPVDFSVSLYLYQEVRKAVVSCINEKLETDKDLGRIQTQVIPGFAVVNLRKAPIRKSYNEVRYLQMLARRNDNKIPWWNQNHAGITVKDIKQFLQKAFNLL